MSDPANLTAIDDVKFNTGYTVEPVVASDQALKQLSSATTTSRSNMRKF